MLDNAERLLGAAWHGMVPSMALTGDAIPVQLLGETWHLHRSRDGVSARGAAGQRPHAALERYGMVWLAPQEPLDPFPELPEMADPEFVVGTVRRSTRVSAGVLTDNFLDVTHFSYLHADTFGRRAPVTTDGCDVRAAGGRLQVRHATDLHEGRGLPGGRRATGRSETWRVATYTLQAPYVTHLQMTFPVTGHRSAATLICRPATSASTEVTVLVAWPATDRDGLADQLAFSADVLDEDLRMLESMADPRLQLSLRGELHTRADRAAVEYRRLLARQLRAAERRADGAGPEGAGPRRGKEVAGATGR